VSAIKGSTWSVATLSRLYGVSPSTIKSLKSRHRGRGRRPAGDGSDLEQQIVLDLLSEIEAAMRRARERLSEAERRERLARACSRELTADDGRSAEGANAEAPSSGGLEDEAMSPEQCAILVRLGQAQPSEGVPALHDAARALARTPGGLELDPDLVAFAMGVHALRLRVPLELAEVIVLAAGWNFSESGTNADLPPGDDGRVVH
jgi:hypothetical protein